ncbi:MAG TPA: hypothetical protein VGY58_19200, partial [Gemmataceae bacterium]|nr:hypothetical protein [Gemmataceae bacterium]
MLSSETIGLLAFLGLGLVVFFAIAKIWWRADAAVERLVDRLPPPERALNLTYPPSRIELLPCVDIPWNNPAEVTASAQRLRALGFQDAGRYQNSENREAYGWAFVHPSVGVTVVWMTFAGKADYFEMATHFVDGTSFAFGNGRLVGLLATPPHWTVRRLSETDPAAVYERMLSERPEKPVDPDHVDDFAVRYQDRWARIMDWRNLQGGFSEDEIRALCAANGLNPTDEMIADCRERIASRALRGIEAAVHEQFLAHAQLSDAEAEALLPWMVVIHDRLEFDMLVPIFTQRWLSVYQEAMSERCAAAEEIRCLDKPPREAFALLNERMPGPRFHLAGKFSAPIAA